MTSTQEKPLDPRMAAAWEEMKPVVAPVAVVGMLGVFGEALVPLVRRLSGRTGVAAGPCLINLANAVIALGAVRYVQARPELRQRRVDNRALGAGLAYLVVAPFLAGRWERAVVLPGRSPLWGTVFSPVGLLQVALMLETVRRACRN